MRYDKRDVVLLSNGTTVIAGVCNGVDSNREPDKYGTFVNVFYSACIFPLDFTFRHVFLKLIINSNGGDVSAGLMLYDQITGMKNVPIEMYCIELAASMATIILASGKHGRYILKHSKVMIHEPAISESSGGLCGSASSISKSAEYIMQTKKRLTEILSDNTCRSVQEVEKAMSYGKIMSADEAGDFVEIQRNLKTNPLIEMLSALKELMALANLFSDKPKNNQSKKDKLMSDAKFNAQIEGLINGLQAGGKKDIICEASGLKVVLPTDENYFLNNNMSEITDGNYKILGKVVQIYKDSGEISLLRNTVFSKLQLDKMKEFQDVFNDPALADFIGNGGITTTIEASVTMIIPIAIYV